MHEIRFDEISPRDAFGEALGEYFAANDNVFFVSSDNLKSMGGIPPLRVRPNQCYNVGISEQSAAMIGAGIASCGAKAFVTTYAPFASMRMLEQIRTFCAYPNLDVKIVGGLCGLSGASEGTTHQGIEDMSIMRSIPNLVVVTGADATSVKKIVPVICDYDGPVYFRIGRNQAPKVFDESYSFAIGKAYVMEEKGTDAALVFCGACAQHVVEAHARLQRDGLSVMLMEMPCVKPLDREAIVAAARQTGAIVTVEDNNIVGGLGSAVSEVLVENHPVPMRRLGIPDRYLESGGEEELMNKYGLGVDDIVQAVKELVARTR